MNVTSPLSSEIANHNALMKWYRDKSVGQRLGRQLSELLGTQLEQVFGYHMLVTGGDIGLDFGGLSKTQRVFRLSSKLTSDINEPSVVGFSSALPVATDSVDALILCHTLDASPAPHHVLRECQRVLVPNGHLFIINFNPTSVWGLANMARRALRWHAGNLRAVSSKRLRDWLSLLGFSYAAPQYLVTLAPRANRRIGRMLNRLDHWLSSHNAPTGCVYIIHARKRVGDHIQALDLASMRPRLITLPLGKTQEGVPVPRQLGRVATDSLNGWQ
jgi:SAM-dependent methyltransferase